MSTCRWHQGSCSCQLDFFLQMMFQNDPVLSALPVSIESQSFKAGETFGS